MKKQVKNEYETPSVRVLQMALESHICSPMKTGPYVDGLEENPGSGEEEGETYYFNN